MATPYFEQLKAREAAKCPVNPNLEGGKFNLQVELLVQCLTLQETAPVSAHTIACIELMRIRKGSQEE